MNDRLLLWVYLLWMVLLSATSDLRMLGAALVLVFAGMMILGDRRLLRRLRPVLIFNMLLSTSYLLSLFWMESISWRYLALINLRVLALSGSTLLMISRVNLLKAFSFSRTLLFLISIANSQILSLRRVLMQFRQAFQSRTLAPLNLRLLYRQRAVTASFLIRKSMHDATEITDAMRSRGVFDAEA